MRAGQRHLGDRDQQAAVADVVHGLDLALADQGADEVAGLDLVGEVDGGRRALELAGDGLLVERLAEVSGLAADRDQQVALGCGAPGSPCGRDRG